jgi:hypothetical protein
MACRNCQIITDPARLRPGNPFHRKQSLAETAEHLGRAWAAQRDIERGQPGWILVLGHLLAAEQHSQNWPDLNKLICESRKGWQETQRRTPDWTRLENLVENTPN